MGHFVPIVLISLCVASTVLSSELPHAVVKKSFDDALRECAQYFLVSDCSLERYYKEGFPDTPEVKQLIRCVLFNLNAYDDKTGVVESVLGNFFKPCSTDDDYAERTRFCIKELLGGNCSADVYTRPYASFLCYYHQYGTLVRKDQFIPKTELDNLQQSDFTFDILNIPFEVIVKYSEGYVLKEPHYPHVLYAWSVRVGCYTLNGGIQLDRLYNMYGVPEILSEKTKQCAVEVAQTYCDDNHVTIVYYTFVNCIQPLLDLEKVVQVVAQKLIACSNSKTADSSKPYKSQ